jgi:hypothetical protein
VQWDSILNSLIGSSPATAFCALAVRALWTRLRERDADLAAANKARIDDLTAILKQLDFEPRSSNRLPELTQTQREQSSSRA